MSVLLKGRTIHYQTDSNFVPYLWVSSASDLSQKKCMETKNTVLARQKDMHVSLEKVKGLVRLIQGLCLPPLPDAPSNPNGIANGETDHPSSKHTDCGSLTDNINGNNNSKDNSKSNDTDETVEPEEQEAQEEQEEPEEQEAQEEQEDLNNSTGNSSNLSTAPEPPQPQAMPPIHVEGAK